jgi:hypothetical protein
MLMTGCDRAQRASVLPAQPENIFAAKSAAVSPNAVPPLRAINNINGDIVVIAALSTEVAADAVETGTGINVEAARIEAQDHMSLTTEARLVQILPQSEMNPGDHAWIHIRVPPGELLAKVSTVNGNIGIYGPVGDVTAAVAANGNIEVMGGNGTVNLATANGSITADLMPDKNVTAHANKGNVEVIAVNAVVTATTTDGAVRFIGTLKEGAAHVLTTTVGGAVTVAVPGYPKKDEKKGWPPNKVIYRVFAQTAFQPIFVDYPPDQPNDQVPLAICGVIHHLGPYDYHVERTQFHFGHFEIMPVLTTTFFLSGTLTPKYYLFETNQPQVRFFTPRSQAIHIYTAADLAQIGTNKVPVDEDCKDALDTVLKRSALDLSAAVTLTLSSGSGRIFVHHIEVQR